MSTTIIIFAIETSTSIAFQCIHILRLLALFYIIILASLDRTNKVGVAVWAWVAGSKSNTKTCVRTDPGLACMDPIWTDPFTLVTYIQHSREGFVICGENLNTWDPTYIELVVTDPALYYSSRKKQASHQHQCSNPRLHLSLSLFSLYDVPSYLISLSLSLWLMMPVYIYDTDGRHASLIKRSGFLLLRRFYQLGGRNSWETRCLYICRYRRFARHIAFLYIT